MENYPLRWPEGWKRSKARKTARYTTTFGHAALGRRGGDFGEWAKPEVMLFNVKR